MQSRPSSRTQLFVSSSNFRGGIAEIDVTEVAARCFTLPISCNERSTADTSMYDFSPNQSLPYTSRSMSQKTAVVTGCTEGQFCPTSPFEGILIIDCRRHWLLSSTGTSGQRLECCCDCPQAWQGRSALEQGGKDRHHGSRLGGVHTVCQRRLSEDLSYY